MPRKTAGSAAVRPPAACLASMRPRPDAAENGARRQLVERVTGGASMRPRPDAAENEIGGVHARLDALELQ